LADYTGCEMPDAGTVVMRFGKPVPEFFFAALMSGTDNYIVPAHVHAGSDPLANPANQAPIGTGPWKFKDWVRGSHVEYVANEGLLAARPALPRPAGPALPARSGGARGAAMWRQAKSSSVCFNPPAAGRTSGGSPAAGKFVATTKGYDEAVVGDHARLQPAQAPAA